MWKEFFLVIFIVTTLAFATSFFIYYNKIDEYKKEKEVYLMNKESELNSREQHIKNMEDCSDKLSKCLSVSNEIRQLLGEKNFKCDVKQVTQVKQESRLDKK